MEAQEVKNDSIFDTMFKPQKKKQEPCFFREETNECGLHRRVNQACDVKTCPFFKSKV